MTEVKPLTESAHIIEAFGHWADDESFIAPAFIIATSEGKLVKPIVSTDSKLTAPGSILTEDLGTYFIGVLRMNRNSSTAVIDSGRRLSMPS